MAVVVKKKNIPVIWKVTLSVLYSLMVSYRSGGVIGWNESRGDNRKSGVSRGCRWCQWDMSLTDQPEVRDLDKQDRGGTREVTAKFTRQDDGTE